MKVTIRATALALAACAAAGSAAAVEKYTPYDNFQVGPLDPARWQDAERSRMINGGANLRLVQRDWGATTSDSGAAPGISWSETIARGGPVTQLRATLKVAAVDVTGCAANPTSSNVRGRVLGSFFNSATAAPEAVSGTCSRRSGPRARRTRPTRRACCASRAGWASARRRTALR